MHSMKMDCSNGTSESLKPSNYSSENEDTFHIKEESAFVDSPWRSAADSPLGLDERKDVTRGMDVRRYELRWRHHQSTMVAEVGSLYRDAALVDVTLACEDQRTYQAHKLVLSACSQYFQGLFSRHPAHQHPIIFLKDVSGEECEALLTFMYRGEVSVSHDQIQRILQVANSLQVRGLAEMETSSSRPLSPSTDRVGHCMSPSPSPSTGPPTKCVSPISEPHSPNPPSLPNATSTTHLQSSLSQDKPSLRHPGRLTPAGGSCPPQPPPLSQDYSPYHLLPSHRSSYDLPGPPGALLASFSESDPKSHDEGKSLGSSYPPQLRVKQDLGGNSWENPAVDVGTLSPLPLADGPRPPFLHHAIFSSLLVQDQHPGGPQPYGRMFPISDPLRRLDRLGNSSGETRIHKCQYCSRKFKRKDHLKTHIRIHTGERPYKCKVCGRGFIQSQQVKIHMKVHIREDSSGLSSSSILGGGTSGGGSLSAIYSELGGTYANAQGRDSSVGRSGHISVDLESSLQSQGHAADPDSETDFGPEIIESDFDVKEGGESHLSQRGALLSSYGNPATSSSTASHLYHYHSHTSVTSYSEHKAASLPSPTLPQSSSPLGATNYGRHRSHSGPLDNDHTSPPPSTAMSVKEAFPIATNLKK